MRISDWSSDVCSSDLVRAGAIAVEKLKHLGLGQTIAQPSVDLGLAHRNIVKNLARCQNPVRDGGAGRRLVVQIDFRLWPCRASGVRVSWRYIGEPRFPRILARPGRGAARWTGEVR